MVSATHKGHHLCGLYHSEEEQLHAMVKFISEGLKSTNNEKVLFVEDDECKRSAILEALKIEGYDVDAHIASGKIVIAQSKGTYLQGGEFDAKRMLAWWGDQEMQMKKEGYSALRITAEPCWLLDSRYKHHETGFVEYELLLNTWVEQSQSIVLCSYNHSRWQSNFLLQILTTHPVTLIEGEKFHNFYYIPPSELLKGDIHTTMMNHWIANLKERKRVEKALVVAKEEALASAASKSIFLATVSHEIRTPLNAVIGMTDVLSEMPLPSKGRECVEIIKSSGRHLLTVLNDVLDSARLESGKVELEHRPMNIKDSVQRAMTMCGNAAEHNGLELKLQVEPGCPDYVMGDATRLGQVIVNLLANAIKFSRHGEIRVKVSAGKPLSPPNIPPISAVLGEAVLLTFSVSDRGIGIPEEKLESIFETFTQADASTTRCYGGTGLGLAICKQIVNLMGGTIKVESKVNVGSTFTFTLPTYACLPNIPSPDALCSPNLTPKSPTPDLSDLRILVAEDNMVNQQVIVKLLQTMSCKCDLVDDGAAAITQALSKEYDVIFMDLHMPNVDGWMAAKAIKEKAIHQPTIVALSACVFQEEEKRRMQGVMEGYITKPVTVHQLKTCLVDVVKGLNADLGPSSPAIKRSRTVVN